MGVPTIVLDKEDNALVLMREREPVIRIPLDPGVSPSELTAYAAEFRGALADAFHAGRNEALEDVVKTVDGMKVPVAPRPKRAAKRKGTMRG
jgi:hypothetical protein